MLSVSYTNKMERTLLKLVEFESVTAAVVLDLLGCDDVSLGEGFPNA